MKPVSETGFNYAIDNPTMSRVFCKESEIRRSWPMGKGILGYLEDTDVPFQARVPHVSGKASRRQSFPIER
jgi:hypothetical protein